MFLLLLLLEDTLLVRPFLPRELFATVLAVLVGFGAVVVASTPAAAELPTAAVALGDSFVSDDGAGYYVPVVDADGVTQTFSGWNADNSNAHSCHRSPCTSVSRANLPGIDARFNLACSGAQPHEIANASFNRPKGRLVASQLDQLRAVAHTQPIG